MPVMASDVPAPCGLENLGNTCFLNAALQCLLYSPIFFYNICSHLKKYLGSSNNYLLEFKNHFSKYSLSASRSVLAPRGIVNMLNSVNRSFILGRQQDSHEWLVCTFDKMMPNKCVRNENGSQSCCLIHNVFGGCLRSQVKCLVCKLESNTFESFTSLSLELLNADSVESALRHFFAEEILDGSNKYLCEKCKVKCKARKHLAISNAPQTLIIHLKRYDFVAVTGSKISRNIKYSSMLSLKEVGENGKNVDYNLTGVLVHSGCSTDSGHYYSYCRGPNNKWFLLDDRRVEAVNETAALGQSCAYILFYTCSENTGLVPDNVISSKKIILNNNNTDGKDENENDDEEKESRVVIPSVVSRPSSFTTLPPSAGNNGKLRGGESSALSAFPKSASIKAPPPPPISSIVMKEKKESNRHPSFQKAISVRSPSKASVPTNNPKKNQYKRNIIIISIIFIVLCVIVISVSLGVCLGARKC